MDTVLLDPLVVIRDSVRVGLTGNRFGKVLIFPILHSYKSIDGTVIDGGGCIGEVSSGIDCMISAADGAAVNGNSAAVVDYRCANSFVLGCGDLATFHGEAAALGLDTIALGIQFAVASAVLQGQVAAIDDECIPVGLTIVGAGQLFTVQINSYGIGDLDAGGDFNVLQQLDLATNCYCFGQGLVALAANLSNIARRNVDQFDRELGEILRLDSNIPIYSSAVDLIIAHVSILMIHCGMRNVIRQITGNGQIENNLFGRLDLISLGIPGFNIIRQFGNNDSFTFALHANADRNDNQGCTLGNIRNVLYAIAGGDLGHDRSNSLTRNSITSCFILDQTVRIVRLLHVDLLQGDGVGTVCVFDRFVAVSNIGANVIGSSICECAAGNGNYTRVGIIVYTPAAINMTAGNCNAIGHIGYVRDTNVTIQNAAINCNRSILAATIIISLNVNCIVVGYISRSQCTAVNNHLTLGIFSKHMNPNRERTRDTAAGDGNYVLIGCIIDILADCCTSTNDRATLNAQSCIRTGTIIVDSIACSTADSILNRTAKNS